MSYQSVDDLNVDYDENVCSRMEKWKVWTIGISLGLAFLGGIIVFSISWYASSTLKIAYDIIRDTIDPTESGFLYNKITGHIDTSKLYDSGRYCIGPGHYFVKYPIIQTTIEFSNRYTTQTRNTRSSFIKQRWSRRNPSDNKNQGRSCYHIVV